MPWGFGSGRAQSLTERGRSQTGRVRLPTFRRQGFMTPFKQAKPASFPPPSCTYFLRRPDWPWKATQDAATKLVQGGGLRAAVSGKHSFDTPPHGRPAFDTPPRVGGIEGPASRHLLITIYYLGLSPFEGPASRLLGISARRQSGSPPDLEWGGHERISPGGATADVGGTRGNALRPSVISYFHFIFVRMFSRLPCIGF